MSTNIVLKSITCIKTSELGKDEVYVRNMEDGSREHRFPSSGYESMSAGGPPWNVELPLSFKDSVVVSLYDNDLAGDDFLGSHTYFPNDPQPRTVEVTNRNGAVYKLYTVPAPA